MRPDKVFEIVQPLNRFSHEALRPFAGGEIREDQTSRPLSSSFLIFLTRSENRWPTRGVGAFAIALEFTSLQHQTSNEAGVREM